MSRIWSKIILVFVLPFFIGCSKYTAKKTTTSNNSSTSNSSNSSSTGSGATPLGSGSSGSGGSSSSGSGSSSGGSGSSGGSSTGSGSSGSGGSGSGSSGSGGSTIGSGSSGSGGSGSGGNTLANTYIQGLNYSSVSGVSMFADSATLLSNGYYTNIYAGNVKVGANYANQQKLTVGTYLLSPYTFYSLIVFDGPQVPIAGTILPNGNTTPAINRAYIRFINLDPTTKNANVVCSALSYADSSWFMNRKYLDHETDTTLTQFKDVYATTSTITFKVNNQIVKTFQQAFEQGKKYTIFLMTDIANNNVKYYVARHN